MAGECIHKEIDFIWHMFTSVVVSSNQAPGKILGHTGGLLQFSLAN